RLAVRGMPVEGPRRRKLSEFVADHVLGDEHRNMLLAVMDAEGEAHELRQDGRAARPDLDHRVRARPARLLRLLQQISVDERTFPHRATHVSYPFFFGWRLRRIYLSVDRLCRVFLPLVDLPHGVTGCRPPEV